MVTSFRPDGVGIKELVDELTYKTYGDESWNLLSIKMLITLNTLKKLTGWMIIINTWSFKSDKFGRFNERGLRHQLSTTGAKEGAHPKGLAFDCDCYDVNGKRINPDDVRKFIYKNIDHFEHIRCIEVDINWVHIDCMGWEESEKRLGITHKNILLYSPKTGSRVIDRKDLVKLA